MGSILNSGELSSRCTMTRRKASKMMPQAWTAMMSVFHAHVFFRVMLLTYEPKQVKLDFTKRRDEDSEDNQRHVAEDLEVWRHNFKGPCNEQRHDSVGRLETLAKMEMVPGSSYLEHLDKRDAEVEIGEVSADQAQAEQDDNGKDGSLVGLHVHGDIVSRVKQRGVARHELCDNGSKRHMPCCEE